MGFSVNAASCAAAAAGAAPPDDTALLFAALAAAAGLPVPLLDAVLVEASFAGCAGFTERARVSGRRLRNTDMSFKQMARCAWLHGLHWARCGP